MTMEEAIKHAEEKAKCGGKCGEEHAQLAMWLKELQKLRAVETEKRTEERTKTHACDCISRQAAIKAVMGLPTWWADEGGYYGGAQPPMEALLDPEDAVSAIENLPSAQPKREKGKWLPDNRPGGGFWVCSCCKFPSEAFAANVLYEFCPNCGAYMKGENDG